MILNLKLLDAVQSRNRYQTECQMKAILGLVLACSACCAVPFVAAGFIGAGTAGAVLSFWQWGLGVTVAALASVGAVAIWYRRNRTYAAFQVSSPSSNVQNRCCPSNSAKNFAQSLFTI